MLTTSLKEHPKIGDYYIIDNYVFKVMLIEYYDTWVTFKQISPKPATFGAMFRFTLQEVEKFNKINKEVGKILYG
jgi:hypothetical protein